MGAKVFLFQNWGQNLYIHSKIRIPPPGDEPENQQQLLKKYQLAETRNSELETQRQKDQSTSLKVAAAQSIIHD